MLAFFREYLSRGKAAATKDIFSSTPHPILEKINNIDALLIDPSIQEHSNLLSWKNTREHLFRRIEKLLSGEYGQSDGAIGSIRPIVSTHEVLDEFTDSMEKNAHQIMGGTSMARIMKRTRARLEKRGTIVVRIDTMTGLESELNELFKKISRVIRKTNHPSNVGNQYLKMNGSTTHKTVLQIVRAPVVPQKLQKINNRVTKLLVQDSLTASQYSEAQEILNKLQQISYLDRQCHTIIADLKIQVAQLLDKSIQTSRFVFPIKTEASKELGADTVEISPQNQDMQAYLEKLLGLCTHALSSTKKGHATVADGNVTINIIRPFFNAIQTQLLSYNQIDAHMISWKDIVDRLTERVQDDDKSRKHLYGILKKYTTRGEWKDLFPQLIQALEAFGGTGAIKKTMGRTPLQNLIPLLQEHLPYNNPPPSR